MNDKDPKTPEHPFPPMRGMSLEEIISKYPQMVVKLLKDQQARITKLEKEIEQLTSSRDTLADELRQSIKKDK